MCGRSISSSPPTHTHNLSSVGELTFKNEMSIFSDSQKFWLFSSSKCCRLLPGSLTTSNTTVLDHMTSGQHDKILFSLSSTSVELTQ